MANSRDALTSGDRPFPWRCPHCLAKDVWPEVMPYTAKSKHDGVEYAIDIPALEIPKCRNCGELLFSYHVDEQIRDALRSRLRLLTPAQIRAGRKALSLHQSQLAERLGVAAETISRWENGASFNPVPWTISFAFISQFPRSGTSWPATPRIPRWE